MQLVEHQLASDALATLLLHVDQCERCRQTIALLAGGTQPVERAARDFELATHRVRPNIARTSATAPSAMVALGSAPTQIVSPMEMGDETPSTAAPAAREIAAILAGPQRLPPGTRVAGRYTIEAELGAGGMGVVYQAYDASLQRSVALKVQSATHDERLAREAVAMAQLAHPNVVTVYEVGAVESGRFVAMERVVGGTLRQWLAVKRPPPEVLRVLLDAGAGLAAAHAAGLVHRDVKPENLLIGADGRVRVSDFGLVTGTLWRQPDVAPEATAAASTARAAPSSISADAAFAPANASLAPRAMPPAAGAAPSSRDSSPPLTEIGARLGTPLYMAPEQLDGTTVDARSDQFAFCATAWEALTGHRPFHGRSVRALREAIANGPRVPRGRRAVRRLLAVLRRGLAEAPAARYPSMTALLIDLRRAAAWQRRARYALAGGLATAAVAVMWLVVNAAQTRVHQSACAADALQGRAVFSQAEAAALRAAFADRPEQAAGVARMISVFASTAEQLVARRLQVCRSAASQSAVARAQNACLSAQQQRLRTLVATVRQMAPRQKASTLLNSLWSLRSRENCLDPTVARSFVPAINSALAIAGWQDALHRAQVEREMGQAHRALASFFAMLAAAQGMRDNDAVIETLVEVGASLSALDQVGEGRRYFLAAAALAEARGLDQVAAGALMQVASLSAQQGDLDEAGRYLELARAKQARLGTSTLFEEAALDRLTGELYTFQYRLKDAVLALQSAADKYARAIGGDDPLVGATLGALGQALQGMGNVAAARNVFTRALAILQSAYGPESPNVAVALGALAEVDRASGNYDAALARLQESAAIFARTEGRNSINFFKAELFRAELLRSQQKVAASVTLLRQILVQLRAVEGHPPPFRASILVTLASAEMDNGASDEARRAAQEAIAIYRQYFAADSGYLAEPMATMARVELAQGNAAQALVAAQTALRLVTSTGTEGLVVEGTSAEANLMDIAWSLGVTHSLATAQWKLGKRVQALASVRDALTRARNALAQPGAEVQPADEAAVTELQGWLAAHERLKVGH